jgi:hypothetical protein
MPWWPPETLKPLAPATLPSVSVATLYMPSGKTTLHNAGSWGSLLPIPRDRHDSREVSSATMSAAGCDALASATLCPAHIESASISPVVPAMGGAGS